MHTAGTARLGIECALKDRAEDGRADLRPVKVGACLVQKEGAYLLGDRRYLDILVGEQPAVHIGKCRKPRIVVCQIRTALLRPRVQYPKELRERSAHLMRLELRQIVMEHGMMAEDARVLRIEAEDQPHAQHIQAPQCAGALGIGILPGKCVIEDADDLARGDGYLHLPLQMLIAALHEELEAIVFAWQILQPYLLGLATRALHIIDIEGAEVAGHDPARVSGDG